RDANRQRGRGAAQVDWSAALAKGHELARGLVGAHDDREALFELERRIHQHDVVLAYRQLEGGRRGVAADVLAVDHDARPRFALEHDVTGRTMRPRCVSMVI